MIMLKQQTLQLNRLEERFVFEEISKAQHDKFSKKLIEDKKELKSELEQTSQINLSNLEKVIEKSLDYALNLSKLWASGNLMVKQGLQNMIFPEGILYNFQNHNYRTFRVNKIFDLINCISVGFNQKKNGTNSNNLNLSRLVAGTGLEPVTFGL